MARTIVLKGVGIRKEGVVKTGQTITPGMLLDFDSGGVKAHAVAAGTATKSFAVENELLGKEIDVNYTADDNILYEVLPPGAEVNALVAAAAGAIAVGDYLESAGNGTLRKQAVSAATAQTSRDSVVARALEAVDNSAGGASVRIKVEVL